MAMTRRDAIFVSGSTLGLVAGVHYCRFIASDRAYVDEPLSVVRPPAAAVPPSLKLGRSGVALAKAVDRPTSPDCGAMRGSSGPRDGRSDGRVARVASLRPWDRWRAPVTFASACSRAWANSPADSTRLEHGRVSAAAHVLASGIGARQRSHDRTLPTRAQCFSQYVAHSADDPRYRVLPRGAWAWHGGS